MTVKLVNFFGVKEWFLLLFLFKVEEDFFFDHYDILKYDNRDPKRLNEQIILLFYSCLDGEC